MLMISTLIVLRSKSLLMRKKVAVLRPKPVTSLLIAL